MVQIPRYISVEVTGCIGMAATSGYHLRPRHTEMSTERILTSPLSHRRKSKSMDEGLGVRRENVDSAACPPQYAFWSMNEEQENVCGGGSYLSAVVICLEGITHKVSKRSSAEHRQNAHIETSPSAQTTSTSELISTFSVSAVNNNCDKIAGYESIDFLCFFLVPMIACRDETHASTCWIHALT